MKVFPDDVINSNLKRLEQKYGGYEVKKDGNTLVAMYEGVTAVFPESLTMEEYNEGYLTDFLVCFIQLFKQCFFRI